MFNKLFEEIFTENNGIYMSNLNDLQIASIIIGDVEFYISDEQLTNIYGKEGADHILGDILIESRGMFETINLSRN